MLRDKVAASHASLLRHSQCFIDTFLGENVPTFKNAPIHLADHLADHLAGNLEKSGELKVISKKCCCLWHVTMETSKYQKQLFHST